MSHEFFTPKQILELAIGYENGIVNFRMLHTLLHILINNVDGMDTSRIKFSTSNDKEIESDLSGNVSQKTTSIVIREYLVGKDNNGEEIFNQKIPQETNVVKKVIVISNNDTNSRQTDDSLMQEKSRSSTSMATDQTNATKQENSNTIEEKEISLGETRDNCSQRFDGLENAFKNLTSVVNDLSRNFNVLETTIATLTDNGEIGRMKSKLDDLEKICHGKSENGSEVVTQESEKNEEVKSDVSSFIEGI